jgi:hypothetical protein
MQVLVPYTINDAALASSNVTETDYSAWSAGTAYAVGNRVIRTTGLHRVYERLVAGTTATAPEADSVNWLDVTSTNRWAMFDNAVGTSTSRTSPITVSLSITGPVNDIILFGVVGSSVNVTITSGSVNRTTAVPAAGPDGTSVVSILGLGSPSGGTVTLTLTGSGTVSIGTMAVGNMTAIGETQRSASLGISDFSKKEFDTFGNPALVQRNYSRKMQIPVTMAASGGDQFARIMTALRSTPAVWVGVPWLESLVVFGFLKEWELNFESKNVARGSLSLESLAMGGL